MIEKMGRIEHLYHSGCLHMTVDGFASRWTPGEPGLRWAFRLKAEEETRSLSGVSPLSAFLALKSHSLCRDSKALETMGSPAGANTVVLNYFRCARRPSGLSEKSWRGCHESAAVNSARLSRKYWELVISFLCQSQWSGARGRDVQHQVTGKRPWSDTRHPMDWRGLAEVIFKLLLHFYSLWSKEVSCSRCSSIQWVGAPGRGWVCGVLYSEEVLDFFFRASTLLSSSETYMHAPLWLLALILLIQ